MSLDRKLKNLYSNKLDAWLDGSEPVDPQVLRDINAYVIAVKSNAHQKKLISLRKKLEKSGKVPVHVLEGLDNFYKFPVE